MGNGTVTTQGQLERPFIFFENGEPAYIFFATMDGPREDLKMQHGHGNMVIPIMK